jgi:hypothetical protein
MTTLVRAQTTFLLTLCVLTTSGCAEDGTNGVVSDRATEAPPWFREVAVDRGVTFVHHSGYDGQTPIFPEIMGGGIALVDVDGDQDLDLYFVQSGDLRKGISRALGNELFLNDGTAHFTKVEGAGGADDSGYGMGVTVGDYDGDGDDDLYVTNVGANRLYQNQGEGTFLDVTTAAGVGDGGWGTSAAFLDIDVDGDLDLFVTNYVEWRFAGDLVCYNRAGQADYCSPGSYNAPQPDVLYRNRGDGTFEDISAEAGLRTAFGNGLGVSWSDFDEDGHLDIFVANDGLPNQFWRGRGDGTFVDEALAFGCSVDRNGKTKAGMGTAVADFDDDGDLDLLVVNMQAQADSLFRNEGDFFVDHAPAAGLGAVSRESTRFGVGLHDFDRDGYLDIYQANGRVTFPDQLAPAGPDPFAEANLLLTGTSTGRFDPWGTAGGTATPLLATSRGAAFGDLDNDGALDLVVVNRDGPAHVLMNVVSVRGHWIRFRVLNEQGSDALGAQVRLRVGTRTLRRDVHVTGSYCASGDPRAHFGLGIADEVHDIEVRWAGGKLRHYDALAVDREHLVQF